MSRILNLQTIHFDGSLDAAIPSSTSSYAGCTCSTASNSGCTPQQQFFAI